jgi:hypothetical protein
MQGSVPLQFGAGAAATSPAGLSSLGAAAIDSMISDNLVVMGIQPQRELSMLDDSSSSVGGARVAAAYAQDKGPKGGPKEKASHK